MGQCSSSSWEKEEIKNKKKSGVAAAEAGNGFTSWRQEKLDKQAPRAQNWKGMKRVSSKDNLVLAVSLDAITRIA